MKIKNVGTADLKIIGHSFCSKFGIGCLTPRSIKLVNFPADGTIIKPGAFAQFATEFIPRNAGTDVATLKIISNDPDESPFVLDLCSETLEPDPGTQDLHIQLEWKEYQNLDIDLHLVHPTGKLNYTPMDCFYCNASPDWGVKMDYRDDAFLDRDNIDTTGPENINLESPEKGIYKVYAHFYQDNESSDSIDETDATVKIWLGKKNWKTTAPDYSLKTKMSAVSEFWHVGDLSFPAKTFKKVDSKVNVNGGKCNYNRP